MLAIAAVLAVSEYVTELWLTRAGERIVHDLRVALYGQLQRLSLAFHNRQQKGDLVTRVTGDVNAVGTLFSESLGEIVAAALLLIGMAVISFVLDPLLALVTLAVVPLLFVVTVYYGRRVKVLARRQRREEGQIASLAAETLAAMPVVKAFGSEEYESDRVASRSALRREIGVEAAKAEARFSGLVEIIGAIVRGSVLVFGVFRVAAGAISPGDLVVFVTYANKTYRPLRDIARQATKVSRAMARADRVAAILAADQVLEERSGSFGAGRAAGDVELERVSFRYSPDRPALSELSLRVPAGSRVALVGPSGAGKSTVGALVARLYDPDEGRVLIDGRDARECTLAWLRDQVGFLLQETMLFAGSVAENIEYAASGASRDAVVEAAKTAGAHEFITRLPQGYDTDLGPSGIGLSGGQRQRIGIARVLLRDPAILVLDEPTTGLDATSEDELMGGLESLMRGRTTFVITHSTGLARRAERVVVIADGRVVEDGPPEQLIEELHVFRDMAERQGMATAPGPRQSNGLVARLVTPPLPLPPADPALPALHGLLDVDAAAPVLKRSLHPGAELTDLRLIYAQFKRGRRLIAGYEATIGGARHQAVAICDTKSRSRQAGPPARARRPRASGRRRVGARAAAFRARSRCDRAVAAVRPRATRDDAAPAQLAALLVDHGLEVPDPPRARGAFGPRAPAAGGGPARRSRAEVVRQGSETRRGGARSAHRPGPVLGRHGSARSGLARSPGHGPGRAGRPPSGQPAEGGRARPARSFASFNRFPPRAYPCGRRRRSWNRMSSPCGSFATSCRRSSRARAACSAGSPRAPPTTPARWSPTATSTTGRCCSGQGASACSTSMRSAPPTRRWISRGSLR